MREFPNASTWVQHQMSVKNSILAMSGIAFGGACILLYWTLQRHSLSIQVWIVMAAAAAPSAGFLLQKSDQTTRLISLLSGLATLCLLAVAYEGRAGGPLSSLATEILAATSTVFYYSIVMTILRIPIPQAVKGKRTPRTALMNEVAFTAAAIAVPIYLALLVGERDKVATLPQISAETTVAIIGVVCLLYLLLRFHFGRARLFRFSIALAVLTFVVGLLTSSPLYLSICVSLALLGVGCAATIALSLTDEAAQRIPKLQA